MEETWPVECTGSLEVTLGIHESENGQIARMGALLDYGKLLVVEGADCNRTGACQATEVWGNCKGDGLVSEVQRRWLNNNDDYRRHCSLCAIRSVAASPATGHRLDGNPVRLAFCVPNPP